MVLVVVATVLSLALQEPRNRRRDVRPSNPFVGEPHHRCIRTSRASHVGEITIFSILIVFIPTLMVLFPTLFCVTEKRRQRK